MIYKIDVPIPANTAVDEPVNLTMGLTKGRIKRIAVYFPWGCAGLAGIQIIRRTYQLAPLTRGEWLVGNELLLDHMYNYDLDVEPYQLVVFGHNLDDTYDHTPFVVVEIMRDDKSIALDKLLSEL